MINVATVHFKSARWIDVQLAYLQMHMTQPFRVFANLEGVPGEHGHKFHRVVPAAGPHGGKLNLLAAEITSDARPDDIIMFLDGDAFPIRDPLPTIFDALSTTSLVAVRRHENLLDPQPHPSFCAITVGEWERLHGDWSPGYCWTNSANQLVTDVGANLLGLLERTSTRWTPLSRSNRVNLHPLWFGIYGGIVYHQGAGFRQAMSRVDRGSRPAAWSGDHAGSIGRLIERVRLHRWEVRTAARAKTIGDELFKKLESDPQFFLELL